MTFYVFRPLEIERELSHELRDDLLCWTRQFSSILIIRNIISRPFEVFHDVSWCIMIYGKVDGSRFMKEWMVQKNGARNKKALSPSPPPPVCVWGGGGAFLLRAPFF